VRKIINGILFISFLSLIVIWLFADIPLFSPIAEKSDSFSKNKNSINKKIYGFLPYWNMDNFSFQEELTDVAYFSLTINEDGSLKTRDGENLDPGFFRLQSDEFSDIQNMILNKQKKTHIVLSLFENKKIESFLDSDESSEKFFQSLDSVLLAYPFSGLNLDIEYTGEANQELRDKYTLFIKKLSQHIKARYKGEVELSIDTYAAAASKKMIWDINSLHQHVDYIVVMAYDFHRSSSTQSGPVAPLFKKQNSWKESIHSYLADFAKKVPTHKILLGVPFYGYEWQTTTREPQSFTFPKSGATASYKRVQELLKRRKELQIEEGWDNDALAPYLTYVEDDEFFTIYYENAKSIEYKLDYVNQLELGGIAIWSLGYEGNSREIWDTIQQTLLHEQATSSTNQ
jgi:spore germination protein YaaH